MTSQQPGTVLEIIRMGHPMLAQRAQEVDDPTDPKIHKVVNDLLATAEAQPAAGLAAPQVKVPLRILVFQIPEGRSEQGEILPLQTLLNPSIEFIGDEKELG